MQKVSLFSQKCKRVDDFCKNKYVRKNNFAKFRLFARMDKMHFQFNPYFHCSAKRTL